jgi:redox-sensitive bicupin YhaK (pirin superfamily)
MDTQTETQIYLADQRGCSQTNLFRSYHTFNFGSYVAEGRQPFGSLHLLNEDAMRAGAALNLRVDEATDVILLPLEGGLEYQLKTVSTSAPDFLEPGQVGVLSLPAGATYTVTNPYETESIGFLQLWLRNAAERTEATVTQNRFLLITKNTLLPLFESVGHDTSLTSRGFIGQYDGRNEGTYPIPATGRHVFIFVLRGAFEAANRLVHEKDGLALRYEQEDVLEFEALSNGAVLLIIDMPLNR